MLTSDIENFPGFIEGLAGPELMGNMRSQAARFGAEFLTTKAERVDFSAQPFRRWAPDPSTGAEVEHSARSVIVSTGARSLMLGLPAEERLLSKGVSTCATCDGFFFRGQEIAVIGGGDSALEEAMFLTKFGETVTVVHRRKELRASKIMQDRAFKNAKIKFVWDSVVTDIAGTSKVEGIHLRNTATGEDSYLPVGGVFVAIGHVPNTNVFNGTLDMDDAGYLVTAAGSTATNVPGVFACGDVQDHTYRQAITAAGTGCMAAIDVERWLEAAGHDS
jgi:thioredoxin reductase (NADPH)